MFFLRQIFHAREKLSPSEEGEMGFLDHLEDLRRTVLSIILTLLAAMVACFSFAPSLMNVLRHPVDKVWESYETSRLPDGVEVHDWILAKNLADVRKGLEGDALATLESHFTPGVRELSRIVPLLHAASLLPEADQEAYLSKTANGERQRDLALRLHGSKAELKEGEGRAALKLMGAFQPGEAFMLSLQLSFFCGLIISFPIVVYFLLRFIVPGLLAHERKLLYQCIFWGVGLFLAGCLFAYFIVLPRVLSFFYTYSLDMGIENDWRIGYYLTFAAKLVFVFGVVFELPVIVLPLVKLGILTYDLMKKSRGYALIGCFAVALVLSPAPDPGTMLVMALPMYALYEACILFAWRESRRKKEQLR